MRNRNTPFFLRWLSLLFISAALVLTITQLIAYSRQRATYPAGMTIAGVPVGGVDPQTASQRVLQVYSMPVELQYADAVIHIDPAVVGFSVDIESMIAAADLARTGGSFWGGFWDYLWNRDPAPVAIPLRATLSEERLRAYLENEIAARYDQPATPAQPVPGSTTFTPGRPGQELDIDRAVILIEDALRSPTNRRVSLSYQRTPPTRPPLENLETLLKQIITVDGFDGVIGLYLLDLQTGQEIHFALNGGQEISVQPDVAFTASSTVKIPIMVSYFIHQGKEAIDEQTSELILDMIRKSENPPADLLMQQLDEVRGPLIVTEDMQALGLENTFLAGYFYEGAPLLATYRTPANQRTDVDTDPDRYNQTTPSDMGMLLEDIYQCAQSGGGALIAAFPEQLSQEKCQQMINFLVQDKIGVLIEAGVPEGTQVAHKHGWVSDVFGVIHNVSDAAIVYTPGGNYVLTIYAYHPVQALWDPVSTMFAELSQAVYNYFNLPSR
ncbi:MAG: class A beta-lactamase-related serine hydrolase [Anaerolineae bacterium]|nr:MAG: class A beta-lactamase-related serine hydrolase [Anaerolineae bacterium]